MNTREVQEWLCLHGLHVEIDGVLGPATRAALRAVQDRFDLAPSGTVGDETANCLRAPITRALRGPPVGAELRTMIVNVARAHLDAGAREIGGPNSGPWVRLYMDGREGSTYPWCAGFATYVVRQAAQRLGASSPVPRTYSCDVIAQNARRDRRFIAEGGSAQAGDLFLVRKAFGDWVHTGIVTAWRDDHVETIEGNTNKAGEREGTEVRARRRGLANLDFVRVG